jgi:hypothetical protein
MRTVISEDGTPIAFDQSGQGHALILVAGALTTRAAWTPLAAHLAPYFSMRPGTMMSVRRSWHGEHTSNN